MLTSPERISELQMALHESSENLVRFQTSLAILEGAHAMLVEAARGALGGPQVVAKSARMLQETRAAITKAEEAHEELRSVMASVLARTESN